MKKIFSIVLVLLLCVITFPVCQAQGNVKAIIAGKQDYLVLATVVDFDDSSIIIAPYHVVPMFDSDQTYAPLNENISVEKFRYSYCNEHADVTTIPKAGDNICISLNFDGNKFVMANGAYKISSVDYKLLTFYASESMRDSECLSELVALAYFVRTNGSMRNFSFENGELKSYVNDRVLTLYPTNNIAESITFLNIQGKVLDIIKTKDVIVDGEEPIVESVDYRWLVSYGMIFFGVIIGGVVVYNATAKDILNRKKNKNEG